MNKIKLYLNKFFTKHIIDPIVFQCNICGNINTIEKEALSREVASCDSCESTVRMRSIIHILSMELFGKSLLLDEFSVDKTIRGIGMSDWDGYAVPLSKKLDYTNTFYHKDPRLDITSISPDQENTLDFVISTDVYEHVLFPVSRAFENTKRLLKKTGVFVFTVPYTKEGNNTQEHFGELNDFEIVEVDNEYILKDLDRNGVQREFDDLVFHGGPGSTLEMRVFSESSLVNELKNAGFTYVNIYNESYLKYGIIHKEDWSLPIAARWV